VVVLFPVARQAAHEIDDPRLGIDAVPVTTHIPDPGQHTRRSYGAYSNRARVSAQSLQDLADPTAEIRPADQDSDFAKEARRTWARLLRKIFEVDPLLCSCGARMKVVSVITEPRVIHRILRHLRKPSCRARNPFESRSPPQHVPALN
jgi:hypothetical protein